MGKGRDKRLRFAGSATGAADDEEEDDVAMPGADLMAQLNADVLAGMQGSIVAVVGSQFKKLERGFS